jgi:hypothetical protein
MIIDYSAAGTSFLIEDVACPVNRLADMTVDLGNMFQKHGYDDASCFGHALEGNLHLVFSQARLCCVFCCGPCYASRHQGSLEFAIALIFASFPF